jgi:hypothetical protein
MGFSIGASQCLVAPPYAAAALLMYLTAWIGDKWRVRGPLIIFNSCICIIGLPIMGYSKILAVRYFGVFLVCMGANSNVPTVLTYQVRDTPQLPYWDLTDILNRQTTFVDTGNAPSAQLHLLALVVSVVSLDP